MKKGLFIIVLFLSTGLVNVTFSQVQNAKVVILQTFSTGAPLATFPYDYIFIDREMVCKLRMKQYSIHEIQPGEHTVCFQFNTYSKTLLKEFETYQLPITVDAGKTCYVEMAQIIDKEATFSKRAEYHFIIQEIDESKFLNYTTKEKYKLKKCD